MENNSLEDDDMKVIATDRAPGAIGPYSQGYEVNGFIYTSGQIPVDPATGNIPEGIAAQAEQSCKNVGAILEAAGAGFEQVIKTTCVAVKELPKGVLCEVEAIAVK